MSEKHDHEAKPERRWYRSKPEYKYRVLFNPLHQVICLELIYPEVVNGHLHAYLNCEYKDVWPEIDRVDIAEPIVSNAPSTQRNGLDVLFDERLQCRNEDGGGAQPRQLRVEIRIGVPWAVLPKEYSSESACNDYEHWEDCEGRPETALSIVRKTKADAREQPHEEASALVEQE